MKDKLKSNKFTLLQLLIFRIKKTSVLFQLRIACKAIKIVLYHVTKSMISQFISNKTIQQANLQLVVLRD